MKILPKIVIFFLAVSLIPLILFGGMAVREINSIQTSSIKHIDSIAETSVEGSTTALNDLGAAFIKQIADDVARQLEIYILLNPHLTVADLQNDQYFSKLAVQPVGDTGYTAVTDVATLTCRFHSNPAIANMELNNLAQRLPGFWGVMSRTQGGHISEGYYDWIEADGSIQQKYMYISIVNATTADGVVLSVAATTYIHEFNMPATLISQKIDNQVTEITQEIDKVTNEISKQTIFFMVFVMLLVFVIGIVLAQSITKPIKTLNNAGKQVADGNLDTDLPVIRTNDEIRDLGDTLNILMGAVKYLRREKESQIRAQFQKKEDLSSNPQQSSPSAGESAQPPEKR